MYLSMVIVGTTWIGVVVETIVVMLLIWAFFMLALAPPRRTADAEKVIELPRRVEDRGKRERPSGT